MGRFVDHRMDSTEGHEARGRKGSRSLSDLPDTRRCNSGAA
jgi:hypothetical protein